MVEARLKGAGMHWRRTHVDPMLALRNLLENFPGPVEALAEVFLVGLVCILHLDNSLIVRPGPDLDKALAAWAS